MATSVAASYPGNDLSQQRFRPPSHPRQSILPLRRERTMIDGGLTRNRESKPVFSKELPGRSSAFSGEKQYDRRQVPTQIRSAKSDEVFHLIDRRLLTGIHGVHHLFRSNDPKQEGKLSKEAFRRVLMQLCGYVNAEEWEKICKMFHLNERDGTITFAEFLSYFPDNEKAKRELAIAKLDRCQSALLTLSQNVTASRATNSKHHLPKLTANYCFSLMKNQCRDPSFIPNDYLPYDCLNDGLITRDHLKRILANFQLNDVIENEIEFEKLWFKFDLDNVGYVRTNIFLRLLDYRVNLADEINANIQRLVSRSSAAGVIERSHPVSAASSKRSRQLMINKHREQQEEEKQQTKSVAPPTVSAEQLPETIVEANQVKDEKEKSSEVIDRELSTKFRMIVHQHRKMIKQLNETDEFIPFLDRKVNEGYFCLKTVFSYLDPKHTNSISNDQLIAALNQFDIPLSTDNIDQFLHKHRSISSKNMIDYNAFLKYFQDRSDSSFLARTLSAFGKEKLKTSKSDLNTIENGIIDLLHHIFLSLTAAFKFLANDIDDLCPEKELFLILKKELSIADNYQFTDQQKNELYQALNCTEENKQKRQVPYKRLLYFLSKTSNPMHKERSLEKREEKPVEKKEEQKPFTPPRKLAYIEKTLNDLIRLRMHTFVKMYSRLDQPRTDKINKEQFYEVLQQMGTDLSRSEINLIWSSSGFHIDRSIPFPNLIRQIIIFNREDNQLMLNNLLQRSQALHDRQHSSTTRSSISTSMRALSSSGEVSDMSNVSPSMDCHQLYERILPYIRSNYYQIKNELIENDIAANGLVDFSALLDIFRHYSVPINEVELNTLIRLDNPGNGSKIQYPFFIRKYHPDGPLIRTSPWSRVHPIYEQLIQRQHAKRPSKEMYDQRTQNPRDLRYLIRLFTSYDRPRKGFLTNDEFHALLHDHGVKINRSDEDYYQLFAKYDKQLRDQYNYTDFFRSVINTIMT